MQMQYDSEADAAYLYLQHPIAAGSVKKTTELNDDVSIDFDAKGKLLGIEILHASKRLPKKELANAKLLN